MRAAEAASVSVRTLSKWLRCYRRDGEEGLLDRSSVPRLISHRTPEQRLQAIAALRWLRLRAAQSGQARPTSRCREDEKRDERGRLLHAASSSPGLRADVEVGEDEKATSGIRIERVMSDNGSAYVSAVHALACKTLGIKHLCTRPYPPRTNGKAERFIRTLLGGWAYGAI